MVNSIWWRLVRRLGQALLVVFGVVCLTFLIVRVVPGDPALAYAGPRASQSQLAQVREIERVLADLDNDYVTPEQAENLYGVIASRQGRGRFEVDLKATEQLRIAARV